MLNYLTYLKFLVLILCRGNSLATIKDGAALVSNAAVGPSWLCVDTICSGGAVAVSGSSKAYILQDCVVESNRQSRQSE